MSSVGEFFHRLTGIVVGGLVLLAMAGLTIGAVEAMVTTFMEMFG
jgi:hypothetical protein